MAACPKGVPWQRVLGAGGRILIREPYASYQRQLLEREGVQFHGARVDMSQYEWRPDRTRKSRGRRRV